jgi:hypothetical protein
MLKAFAFVVVYIAIAVLQPFRKMPHLKAFLRLISVLTR